MSEISIDFSNVKDLPEGWHSAVIFSAEPEVSSKGNRMINVQYKIQGGPFDGRSIHDNWMLETDALFRTKANLIRLGFMDKEDDAVSINVQDLIGFELEIKTFNDEYEGVLRPKCGGVRAPTGDTLEALSEM